MSVLNFDSAFTSVKEVTSSKDGRTWIISTGPIPAGFWDKWRSQKEEIKALGISPKKSDKTGEWSLVRFVLKSTPEPEPAPLAPQVELDEAAFERLLEYQLEHARNLAGILQKEGYALDGSDTGTGKTYSALAVAKALRLRPFVVCPKNVISVWERTAVYMGVEPLGVVNYDLARDGKHRITSHTKKGTVKYTTVTSEVITMTPNPKAGQDYEPKKLYSFNLPSDGVLIFDEAHRTKNRGTQNAELILAAKRAGARILMLSATIGESPLKMYGPSCVLNMWDVNKPWEFYTKFCSNFGCYKGRFGWEFDGRGHMARLHELFYNQRQVASRMNVKDLIERGLFPESKVVVEAYDMNGVAGKIDQAYTEMREELLKIQAREAEVGTTVLAVRQKAREKVEMLKVPTLVEMAQDELESGKSVVVFVNFTATLKALAEKLKTDCTISGENVRAGQNEANIARFKNNKERVIICNVAAAREGISLHDESGEYPRVSLITPDDSAQNIKQCLGRVWRAGGGYTVQKIIFAAQTVEEEVCNNVRAKIENIDTLNDGDLSIVPIDESTEVEDPPKPVMPTKGDVSIEEAVEDAMAEIDAGIEEDRRRKEKIQQDRPKVAEGMYWLGEEIYKVQVAHQGSGFLYGKRLVRHEAGEKASFVYEKGVIGRIAREGRRMTLDEAKAFGALYGICCRCGAVLTDENSIEAGIGPICASKI